MKRNQLLTARYAVSVFCIVTALAPFFAACQQDAYEIVNQRDLTGIVAGPLKGESVQKSVAGQPQFTGKIAWEQEDAQSGEFAAFTGSSYGAGAVYRAVLTLTAKSGYTFDGLKPDSFVHGRGVAKNPAGTNDVPEITVSVQFLKTAEANENTISATDLTSLILSPVKGQTPQATVASQPQFTSTIVWKTAAGADHSGVFAPATVYKALLTLTAATGYSLSGLGHDSFTYSNAEVVFDVFAATAAITFKPTAGENEDSPVNMYGLTSLIATPAKGGTPPATLNTAQYTGAIVWKAGETTLSGGDTFTSFTVYTAAVTLTAKTGFTFSGVPANIFVHENAETISNAVDSGAVTIVFKKTTPNISYIAGNGISSVKVCCYPSNGNGPSKLYDNNTTSFCDYGWEDNNLTDYSDMKTGVTFNGNECGHGHVGRMSALSLPPAHFYTIDLGSVKTNLVNIQIYPRDNERLISRYEVFVSDSEIGPNPAGATSLVTGDFTYVAKDWNYTMDLTALTGLPAAGRYLQIRAYGDTKNGFGSEWINTSFAEIRIGIDN